MNKYKNTISWDIEADCWQFVSFRDIHMRNRERVYLDFTPTELY